MSFVQSIINNNTLYSANATAPATPSGATDVYVTIYPWPRSGMVERITISGNNSIANVTVTILTDGAAYRAASAANKPRYVVATATGSMTNGVLICDLTEAYYEDLHKIGALHVLISAASITAGTIFTVKAEGRRVQSTNTAVTDGTGFVADRSFKVLFADSGGTVSDITGAMIGNGGSNFDIDNASDYIYVGSTKLIKQWLFAFSTPSSSSGSALTAEVWNGTAWVAASTVLDNTSDGFGTPGSFRYSGVIAIDATAWIPNQVTNDPLTKIISDIASGDGLALTAVDNPKRYWARFKIAISGTSARLAGIKPVSV